LINGDENLLNMKPRSNIFGEGAKKKTSVVISEKSQFLINGDNATLRGGTEKFCIYNIFKRVICSSVFKKDIDQNFSNQLSTNTE